VTEIKLTKEQIYKLCKEIEKTAKSEYGGEDVQVCHISGNRVWVDQRDLDWLADDLQDPSAKRLRGIMKYSIDFEGGYYYYDFKDEE
jgi:hypothetical protein